jgi:hypothetical protein
VYEVSCKFGANNTFQDAVKQHEQFVRSTGLFDNVFEYFEFPAWIRNDTAWKQHTFFLTQHDHPSARGGGFWFWKPAIINHHLQQLNNGDFLVYADSDVTRDFKGLPFVLAKMEKARKNFAMPLNTQLEKQRTKRDVYEAYCHRNPEQEKRSQGHANFMIFRKDRGVMQFVYQWLQGAKNYHAISTETSYLPDVKSFIAHREDQSILNVILGCRYGDPSKIGYSPHHRSRHVKMYHIPIWNSSKVDALIDDTSDTFEKMKQGNHYS